MARAERLGIEPDRARNVGSQIVHERIGALGERVQPFHPGRRFEIERDRVLAAIEFMKRERIVVEERLAHPTAVVAAVGLLDFDDGRAEVGEDGAGVRPGQDLTDLDDG